MQSKELFFVATTSTTAALALALAFPPSSSAYVPLPLRVKYFGIPCALTSSRRPKMKKKNIYKKKSSHPDIHPSLHRSVIIVLFTVLPRSEMTYMKGAPLIHICTSMCMNYELRIKITLRRVVFLEYDFSLFRNNFFPGSVLFVFHLFVSFCISSFICLHIPYSIRLHIYVFISMFIILCTEAHMYKITSKFVFFLNSSCEPNYIPTFSCKRAPPVLIHSENHS